MKPETERGEAMNEEKSIWRGSSSQVVFLKTYLVCGFLILLGFPIAYLLWKFAAPTSQGGKFAILAGLLLWFAVPAIIILWKWILVRSRVYELTSQRVRVTTGILTKRTDEMELYRVKDYALVEPFIHRVFGVGNLDILTYDTTTPSLRFEAVPKPADLREKFRTHVEACRTQKGVHLREVE